MFLPIPAKRGTMTKANVLNMKSMPSAWLDMERALDPPTLSAGSMLKGSLQGGDFPRKVEIFESARMVQRRSIAVQDGFQKSSDAALTD